MMDVTRGWCVDDLAWNNPSDYDYVQEVLVIMVSTVLCTTRHVIKLRAIYNLAFHNIITYIAG